MNRPRPALWKRLLRFTVFAVIALITLTALALSWISFQSRREWAQTKAELLARGEKLSFVEHIPPPIPDAQNVFGDSMWHELTDMVEVTTKEGQHPLKEPRPPRGQRQLDVFHAPVDTALIEQARPLLKKPNQDRLKQSQLSSVLLGLSGEMASTSDPATRRALGLLTLESLQPAQPILDKIRVAMNRPAARLPIEETVGFDPFARSTIHNYTITLAQIFQAEARANLALDRPEAAAQIILECLRLSQAVGADPSLISLLVATSATSAPTSVIAQGISHHQWTEDQLRAFEATLDDIDLRKAAIAALRSERGNANQFFEAVQTRRAGKNTEAARILELLQKAGESDHLWQGLQTRWESFRALSVANQSAFNRVIQIFIDDCQNPAGLHPSIFTHAPHVTLMGVEAISNAFVNLARAQSQLALARIACALERYWLRHHQYPASLDVLAPDFLPKVPPDVIAGEPLRYRLTNPEHFRLWSIGWNGTDEQGAPGKTPRDMKTGDWLWGRP